MNAASTERDRADNRSGGFLDELKKRLDDLLDAVGERLFPRPEPEPLPVPVRVRDRR